MKKINTKLKEASILEAFVQLFSDVKTSKEPKIIFIAGQPGAGKSYVVDNIRKKTNEQFVVLDSDHLRTFHPEYRKIMKNSANSYEETKDFGYDLADKLFSAALKENKNIIVDSSFGSSYEWFKNNYFNDLKKTNYKIELAALAVNPIISTVGINYRPQTQGPTARKLPQNTHDDYYFQISNNIKLAIKDEIFDKYHLYKRDNLRFGVIPIKSYTKNTANLFFKDFIKERQRELQPAEKNNINNFYKAVINLIKKKPDSTEKLEEFKSNIKVAKKLFQKEANLFSKQKSRKI